MNTFSKGSFFAVSKAISASLLSFCSIFRDLGTIFTHFSIVADLTQTLCSTHYHILSYLCVDVFLDFSIQFPEGAPALAGVTRVKQCKHDFEKRFSFHFMTTVTPCR